ncbi:hypothetical protein [Sphingomonas sp.]|uniref:hypothetical protein n=1 Tax=Sphingomonas sp. TaxID=28214 RepID=UPI003B3A2381
MTTTVQLSIAGRGENDSPLLDDLLDQVRDYFEMINGVAASMAEGNAEQYDWRVVGLSKNSPATITVEAVARSGFPDGANLAARAREQTSYGLVRLQRESVRPLHFTDNVLEAADRFARRVTRGLAETSVVAQNSIEVVFRPADAVATIDHIAVVRADDPVHPYKELGSLEGLIQTVGADAWGHPFIVVRNRLTNADVKCFLAGEALSALEEEPVANVVWKQRRVTALGILRYRSLGKISQADVTHLEFADPARKLPGPADVIDRQFTGGLSSEEYLERLHNGDA